MRFKGTDQYVATDELNLAVNAAVILQRPLLIKGEPGTGKTLLAEQVARAFNAPLVEWHIKSSTKAQHGLYEYDAVARLRDSQLGEDRAKAILVSILSAKSNDIVLIAGKGHEEYQEIKGKKHHFSGTLLLHCPAKVCCICRVQVMGGGQGSSSV